MKIENMKSLEIRKSYRKIAVVFVSVLLICMGGVNMTIAYLSSSTNKVTNTFTPSQVTTKVVESFFNGVKKTNVRIQNTGDIDAYIRADIVITWMNENGDVLGEIPQEGTDYTLTLNNGAGKWFSKEGFYYWPSIVTAYDDDTTKTDKDLTENLIVEAEALKTKMVNGIDYYISIEIISSAIQANPSTAVEQAWRVTVGTDRKLSAEQGGAD